MTKAYKQQQRKKLETVYKRFINNFSKKPLQQSEDIVIPVQHFSKLTIKENVLSLR